MRVAQDRVAPSSGGALTTPCALRMLGLNSTFSRSPLFSTIEHFRAVPMGLTGGLRGSISPAFSSTGRNASIGTGWH